MAITGFVALSGCETCTKEDLEKDGRVMQCFRRDIQFIEMFSDNQVQSTDTMRRRTPMCGKAQEAISCFWGCCGLEYPGPQYPYVRDYTAYLAATAAAQCCGTVRLDDPCDSKDPCADPVDDGNSR